MKTQKELKQIFANEVAKCWGKQNMIDFCIKQNDFTVQFDNGDVIGFEKRTIEKDFCFGYRDSAYNTDDFDRAQNMAEHASKSENYFIEQNLKRAGYDARIEQIESNSNVVIIHTKYTGAPTDCKLMTFSTFNQFDTFKWETFNNYRFATAQEKQILVNALYECKKGFEKRLKTYLKKYGLTKVNTWSYWADA